MDPQKLSQLDPKLRDAYQRVMGTPIPQPQPIQTQTPPPPPSPMPDPTPTPSPLPEPEPTPAPPPSEPIPTIQEPPNSQPQPSPEPIPTPQENPKPQPNPTPVQPQTNFLQMNSEVSAASQNFSTPAAAPQAQAIALKKKNGMMMPILFGVVGLVFVVVYTLFWTKIFNFKLPFLP